MAQTLEEWVEENGLKNLGEQWLVHFRVFGIKEEDQENLVRLCFISLRSGFPNGIDEKKIKRKGRK